MIQTLLFVSGLNTLLQTIFGCRTAVVIDGSYAFIIPAISIIYTGPFAYIIDPYEVCGRVLLNLLLLGPVLLD